MLHVGEIERKSEKVGNENGSSMKNNTYIEIAAAIVQVNHRMQEGRVEEGKGRKMRVSSAHLLLLAPDVLENNWDET